VMMFKVGSELKIRFKLVGTPAEPPAHP